METRFEIIKPSAKLVPYIRHLIISESIQSQTYKVLPDTSVVIGFQYKGHIGYYKDDGLCPLSTAGVTGLLDSYRSFNSLGTTGSILVVFTLTGAAQFFKAPMHLLFRQSLSLYDLYERFIIDEVCEQLNVCITDVERITCVENFLLRMITHVKPDVLVNGAINTIDKTKGTVKIKDLAGMLNTSLSPLEKRFRAIVGASPKQYAGIVRAKHMMRAIEIQNFEQIDYLSSFYDQAHFIHQFKRFTSFTPEQYLKQL